MSGDLTYSWRVKWIASLVLLVAFALFDVRLGRYAEAVQEGSLTRVICVGQVVDIDSGDILRLNDGSALIGTVVESDMDGGVTFRHADGTIAKLRRGRASGDVQRIDERQDQILTMRLLTWPAEMRQRGQDFRGTTAVVGNTFQGRPFSDRVLRIGDRLFVDVPMKRADRIERVDIREYFRTQFLLRMVAALSIATVLVGGVKGILTLASLASSLLFLLGVLVPGALGHTGRAAANAAWLVGTTAVLLGIGWLVARVLSDGLAETKRWVAVHSRRIATWAVTGAAFAALAWGSIALIGNRPVPLALVTALMVTLVTFVLVTGFSAKVVSGSLGVIGGLVVCAVISLIASRLLAFTGMAVELGFLELGTVLYRQPESHGWLYVDLLTAGLIIAALGAMMDVSMSVTSTIHEVKRANPSISAMEAIRAGYNVGKDIMSTMTDTLIFAFIGADLVFIVMPGLVFPGAGRLYPFMRMLNSEETAVEAVHAIMGTMGLVLAIPISAAIAGVLASRSRSDASPTDETRGLRET